MEDSPQTTLDSPSGPFIRYGHWWQFRRPTGPEPPEEETYEDEEEDL